MANEFGNINVWIDWKYKKNNKNIKIKFEQKQVISISTWKKYKREKEIKKGNRKRENNKWKCAFIFSRNDTQEITMISLATNKSNKREMVKRSKLQRSSNKQLTETAARERETEKRTSIKKREKKNNVRDKVYSPFLIAFRFLFHCLYFISTNWKTLQVLSHLSYFYVELEQYSKEPTCTKLQAKD